MKKWDEESLNNEVLKIMNDYNLDTFPSRQFLEGIGRTDIFNAVSRQGGFIACADKWGIPKKRRTPKWSLQKIEEELLKYINENNLERMPSKPELMKNNRYDLGNALTRYKGMQWWSKKIGYPLKDSETTKGNKYERIIARRISILGHEIKQMSTKHPYDLLVNQNVKIDVKVSSPGEIEGWRCHTFRPSKEYPTCDLYICVALDEKEEIETIFVIPSKFAQVTTLCIGGDSKYNSFIDRWDYIDRYTEFYKLVTP